MMRNTVLCALLVLGTASAAAPVEPKKAAAVSPDSKKAPAATTQLSKTAPAASKPAESEEKKVLDEKELQAEIASLQHLSPESGEIESPEQKGEEEDVARPKATVKAIKIETLPSSKLQSSTKSKRVMDVSKLKKAIYGTENFQQKVQAVCLHEKRDNCEAHVSDALFCQLLKRSKPEAAEQVCNNDAPALVQMSSHLRLAKAPEDELAKEMTHDLEMNFNKIAPFGKEDTAKELQDHAAKTQDTLVDAVENAEVAEIKRAVFRALTRLRAATIKEFDTIARLETQAIDAYNDAHHYRAENPLAHLHEDEAPVETDKLKSFH